MSAEHWQAAVAVLLLGYALVTNLVYSVLIALGRLGISDYVRRRILQDFGVTASSERTVPISVLVPAFQEERVIVDSVQSLLGSDYPSLEVVVVNDGSTDGTLERLVQAFDLVRVSRVPRARLPSAPVRGVWVSRTESRLVVVDKANGGKADALNAGLAYARYPLFCAVDSDTVIDDGALVRLVRPFQADPRTVACGGVVRIANGSRVRDGRVVEVRAPSNLLVCVQIVEYLRAFLAGRVGWARLGMLLVISGAFGLFHRQTVIDAGGYDAGTVGEDAELVVRLHRHCRDRGQDYRVAFMADPVCWTEAPSSLRILVRQRDRWHRGLAQTLWKHRRMVGNPRYGVIGLVAMPYYVVIELLGPLIELAGWVVFGAAVAAGQVATGPLLVLVGALLAWGMALTLGALLIEEQAFRRYRSWSCLSRLLAAAMLENVGYRQLQTFVLARSFWRLARRRRLAWGAMTRAGFGGEAAAVAGPAAGGAPALALLAAGPDVVDGHDAAPPAGLRAVDRPAVVPLAPVDGRAAEGTTSSRASDAA